MLANSDLDRLRLEEKAAFQRKQSAWAKYAEAREHTNKVREEMQSAWEALQNARNEMNREFEARQNAYNERQRIWDSYGQVRDYNNSRIDSLRYEADTEHQEMQRCFEQASSEYEYGDRSLAPVYAQEGHEHKSRRDDLNAEISRLAHEVKYARQQAELSAPRIDNSAFNTAKTVFRRAKAHHESLLAEYKRLKAKRDRLRSEFEDAQSEFSRLREEFRQTLETDKKANQAERDRILDKAGVRWSDRKEAKIVKKIDGTTQVYSGGLGKGDGIGHGHVSLDSSGQKTYSRDAFAAHGQQNYTDNQGVTFFDRRMRTKHEIKGISGGINFRGDYYKGKKPGVIGHSTQYYDDNYRVSLETHDGIHEENIHWTNQNLSKGHPDSHKKPEDAE